MRTLSTIGMPCGPDRRKRGPVEGGKALLLSVLFGLSTGLASQPIPKHHAEAGGEKTVFRNAGPGMAYVGSNVCARCHPDIYDTYLHTDMGRSMTLPGENSDLVKLAEAVTVFDSDLNQYLQVFRRGKDFYQSVYALDGAGKEIFRHTEKIAFVIGSGENGFGYLIRRGNYLFEAPLSYYTQSGTWGLSPGYESRNYGFSRPALAACIVCHSGQPRPVKGRDGLFKDPPFGELAIGCESCHGPGELHARERAMGTPLAGNVDPSIVNPAKLPGWLANNICMKCHQGGDVRVLQPGKDYPDLLPGTPLDNTLAILKVPIKSQSAPPSVLLEHYFSMILSNCYRASGGKLSCITCHDPHQEFSGEKKVQFYRNRCMTCHTEKSCALPLEIRLKNTPADDCAGCHMTKRKVTGIEHAALTEHRILARPGEPYPPEAFSTTQKDSPGLLHLSAFPRHRPVPAVTLLQAYRQLSLSGYKEFESYSQALLKQLARTDPSNTVVLAALGRRALSEAKDKRAAIRYLSRAILLGSTSQDDYLLLAELYGGSGQISKAMEVLKRGISLNPYTREFYESLAVNYVKLGDYGQALETINKGLKVFPEDVLLRLLLQKVKPAILTPQPDGPFSQGVRTGARRHSDGTRN